MIDTQNHMYLKWTTEQVVTHAYSHEIVATVEMVNIPVTPHVPWCPW